VKCIGTDSKSVIQPCLCSSGAAHGAPAAEDWLCEIGYVKLISEKLFTYSIIPF